MTAVTSQQKQFSHIHMWIWLIELSYIPLYEELEPETSLQRNRFPCRLTKFHKRSSRRRRFVGSYEQKKLSQNLAVLYGCFQQASICRTLNYCVSGQATLRCNVSTVVYDCSAKRFSLYILASRLSNASLVFENAVMSSSRRVNSSWIYSLVPYTVLMKPRKNLLNDKKCWSRSPNAYYWFLHKEHGDANVLAS